MSFRKVCKNIRESKKKINLYHNFAINLAEQLVINEMAQPTEGVDLGYKHMPRNFGIYFKKSEDQLRHDFRNHPEALESVLHVRNSVFNGIRPDDQHLKRAVEHFHKVTANEISKPSKIDTARGVQMTGSSKKAGGGGDVHSGAHFLDSYLAKFKPGEQMTTDAGEPVFVHSDGSGRPPAHFFNKPKPVQPPPQ